MGPIPQRGFRHRGFLAYPQPGEMIQGWANEQVYGRFGTVYGPRHSSRVRVARRRRGAMDFVCSAQMAYVLTTP